MKILVIVAASVASAVLVLPTVSQAQGSGIAKKVQTAVVDSVTEQRV